jgi:hypothetical protein
MKSSKPTLIALAVVFSPTVSMAKLAGMLLSTTLHVTIILVSTFQEAGHYTTKVHFLLIIDIGAMRYPRIDFMDRVFDLFQRLDMIKDNLLIEYK